ncbi:MAG: glycosyl hydrolase [Porphyromonadaceae bacterium CG2_30_38_12]|nr:MAG: glycosyl hydrolase [Porphyromonadaceae bacterium CG2_30_38_12]
MKKSLIFLVGLSLSLSLVAQKKQVVQYNSISKAEMYVTAKDTSLKLTKVSDLKFNKQKIADETEVHIFVDPTHTFQTVVGIGGALTDAAAEVYAKMPKQMQEDFMQSYYSKEKGIGYTFGRTNIASCDFSSASYNYVTENDSALKSFSVKHDEEFRIPFIKKAIAAAGGKLTLFASPWSPPAWMKDYNNVLRGGSLLPKYHQAWANYFVKFIRAYEAHGIPLWGITAQNEPKSPQKWESCIYTPAQERDFIKYYLGPTLHKNKLADKKLICWDQNRDYIYHQASTILNDPEAAKYVWGVGFHWYETWAYSNSKPQFDNLKRVAEAFPDKKLLLTEGCYLNFKEGKLQDWGMGEHYGNALVNDFNCGAVAWTDWNVLLDERGGPNHVGNYLFAPVHYNTKTSELTYTNIFYYLGHFSKFVRPGAKRIISSSSRNELQTTAFVGVDGKIVVQVLNMSDLKVPYTLWLKDNAAEVISFPHSIATIIL